MDEEMSDLIRISVKENKDRDTKTMTATFQVSSSVEIPSEDYEKIGIRSFMEMELKNHIIYDIRNFISIW